MSMTYSDFVTASADLLILLPTITNAASATPSTDPNFNAILPRAIEYAEQRMYRELNLIQTFDKVTATTTANVQTVAWPTGMIVMNSLYIVTPAGTAQTASNAQMNLLQRTTIEGLNMFWPQGQQTATGLLPKYYATQMEANIHLAPAPDDSYTLVAYGTFRPDPLSATNTTTILTTYIPDVFLACAMIFFSGYQRDFGMQADDPKMAQSWENQYQMLKTSAAEEIARAKSQSAQWTPFAMPKFATSSTRGQ